MRYVSLICLLAVAASLASGDEESHRSLIESSTEKRAAAWHVVFSETIASRRQGDWKDAYGATAEVFHDGRSQGRFRASTVPNFLPGRGKPKDWAYAVVQATCAFPHDLKGRSYRWTRMKRADGQRPCLRLSPMVPTVNVSSLRAAEMTRPELLARIEGECRQHRFSQCAEDILVHSGRNQNWRGSAGCLTIHPDDADAFFELIPEGVRGTLELHRVLEDETARSSYCY